MTYQPKVYRDKGGDRQVVADGGEILVKSGGLLTAGNPYGAADYYVDEEAAIGGDGSSWATAFSTLAAAITASNTAIAVSGQEARRNRIFVCGKSITEDLTVLPAQCDVIGVGFDAPGHAFPLVLGNHTIAAAALGCRFINLAFKDTDGTADLFIIPANSHGITFLNCEFIAKAAGSAGKALEITDCNYITIEGCRFKVSAGAMANIFALAISIEGDTSIQDIHIVGNHITATLGISIVEAGAATMGSLIADNYLRTTGIAIDDNSDDCQVVNNRWMTDVDTTTSTAGYDFSLQLAAGNIQMGVTGLCDTIPFTKIAE